MLKISERIQLIIGPFLPKSAFSRGVGVLVGGTAGAQIILVLAAPVLTRLYAPEDFGMLAVYASLLALFGVVSSLRYELAIPLPEDDIEAANIAVLSLLILALTTLLSIVLVALLAESLATAFGVPALSGYLWLLPVGILFSGCYTIFNYWSIRTKRFSTIAATKLRQAFATIAIQLAAFKLGGVALLLGQVAGQGVGNVSLSRPALQMSAFKQVSRRRIWQAAGRYRRFPIFMTWSGLVNTAGNQLPPILFAAFFSVGAAGFYSVAHRILMLPSKLIGSAIGNVFLSHAADANRQGCLAKVYTNLQDKLIQAGLPPTILLIVVGPDLFQLVFGSDWRIAGNFAQWLSFGIFAGFVASPLSTIFAILEKQNLGLILQLILFVTRFVAILIGAWLSDLIITVALFSIMSAFGYYAYIMTMSKVSGSMIRGFWTSLSISLFYSLVAVTPIIFFKFTGIWESRISFLLGIVLSSAIIAIRYLYLVKNHPKTD